MENKTMTSTTVAMPYETLEQFTTSWNKPVEVDREVLNNLRRAICHNIKRSTEALNAVDALLGIDNMTKQE